jgi:hypothetical protein
MLGCGPVLDKRQGYARVERWSQRPEHPDVMPIELGRLDSTLGIFQIKYRQSPCQELCKLVIDEKFPRLCPLLWPLEPANLA